MYIYTARLPKNPCEWEWFFVFHRIKHANIRFVVHYKNRYKSVLVSKMEEDSSLLLLGCVCVSIFKRTRSQLIFLLFDHEPQTVSFKIDFQCNYEKPIRAIGCQSFFFSLSLSPLLIHEWSFSVNYLRRPLFNFTHSFTRFDNVKIAYFEISVQLAWEVNKEETYSTHFGNISIGRSLFFSVHQKQSERNASSQTLTTENLFCVANYCMKFWLKSKQSFSSAEMDGEKFLRPPHGAFSTRILFLEIEMQAPFFSHCQSVIQPLSLSFSFCAHCTCVYVWRKFEWIETS